MSTNNNSVEITGFTALSLDISGDISLAQLTAQMITLCNQAEEQNNSVIVFRLNSTAAVSKWPGEVSIQEVGRWERAIRRLQKLNRVSIFVGSGATGGPALDLLLAADYRITLKDFSVELPVDEGLVWPGMVLYQLVNQLGLARTRQLLMSDQTITAQWGLAAGLIDEITDTVSDTEQAAVLRLGRISNTEIAIRRQLLNEAPTINYEDALGAYLAACDRDLRRQSRRDHER